MAVAARADEKSQGVSGEGGREAARPETRLEGSAKKTANPTAAASCRAVQCSAVHLGCTHACKIVTRGSSRRQTGPAWQTFSVKNTAACIANAAGRQKTGTQLVSTALLSIKLRLFLTGRQAKRGEERDYAPDPAGQSYECRNGDCFPGSSERWLGSIGNAALCEPARKCVPPSPCPISDSSKITRTIPA